MILLFNLSYSLFCVVSSYISPPILSTLPSPIYLVSLFGVPYPPVVLSLKPGAVDQSSSLNLSWSVPSTNAASVVYRVTMNPGGAGDVPNGAGYHVFGTSLSLLPGAQYVAYLWAEVADGSVKSTKLTTSSAYTGELCDNQCFKYQAEHLSVYMGAPGGGGGYSVYR